MGFFFVEGKKADKNLKGLSPEFLHRHGCNVCPLNKVDNVHPKMDATGSQQPTILICGEAPGRCVGGNSLVDVAFRDKSLWPDGIPIKELVGKEGLFVYSYDIEKEQLAVGKVRKVWKTGRRKVFKVTYEWFHATPGRRVRKVDSLVVTDNHPFLLRNPKLFKDPFKGKFSKTRYSSIKDGLSVGHSLQPFSRGVSDPEGQSRSFVGTVGFVKTEAVFLTEFKIGRRIKDNENCHHVNENTLDDTWDNLECLTIAEHWRHHSTKSNVMFRLDIKAKHAESMRDLFYKDGQSLRMSNWLSDPKNYQVRLDAIERSNEGRSNTVKDLWKDPNYVLKAIRGRQRSRGFSDEEVARRFHKRFPDLPFPSENHKIILIEPVGEQDVYDMEVEKYHNFAVNGIFVHNSEDERGKQFVGKAGKLLRDRIPDGWDSQLRWTNSIHCRPPDNRTPETIELNCCKPRLESDIARTKPRAIFGFGAAPLFQIVNPDSKYRSISLWRGRKLPVKVGGHVCWYFAMHHPSYISRLRKFEPKDLNTYPSDEEFAFAFDVKRAFEQVVTLPEPVIHTVEQATANIELVDNINRVAELLEIAGNDPSCGIDLETNCLRPYEENAKILSIACSSKSVTFAFAVDHPQATWNDLERKQLSVLIKRFLYESQCRKISHHLPFELEWFQAFYGVGCLYASLWEDTMSQAFLLDARQGGLSLDFLCLVHFGLNLKVISGLDRTNLDKVPVHQVLKYNGIDARYHRLLYIAQKGLIKVQDLQNVYDEHIRRILALVLVQAQGVPVDQSIVKQLTGKYGGRIEKALEEVKQDIDAREFAHKFGREFNPLSPRDVTNLLKDILKVDAATTSKGELEHVDYPIAKKIIACREAQKVLSTYISPLDMTAKDNAVFPDGKLHPIFATTRVVSARSSSDSPNVQNFPKRDEERKEVRSQVRSKDQTMSIVSFDYAGIQARNVAMESLDKKLIDAFWHNYDIHSEWRSRILKKYPKWISKSDLSDKDKMKAYRHLAKNKFVFPTFFGAQAFSVSESLNIPKNICEELREEFFDEFPEIDKWHKQLDKFYFKNGYVTGLSGYKCRAPVSSNQRINLPIQGDEARIVLDAIARLAEMEDPRYLPILEVHDDLTFLMPKGQIDARSEVILKTMTHCPFEWANVVPIEVEMSVGSDWLNVKEVGSYVADGAGIKNVKAA